MKRFPVNKYLFAILCLVFPIGTVWANNIQITSKPQLIHKDGVQGTADIFFRLKWENSWRINRLENWDAAWIFVKFREGGSDNNWLHVYLSKDEESHRTKSNVPALVKVGTSLIVKEGGLQSEEAMGVFICRKEAGSGNFTFDSVCLHWNYAAQDLDEESSVSLKVFALEMVYVPKAPFYFGDKGTTASDITIHPDSAYIYTHAYNTANYAGLKATYKGGMPLTYFSNLSANAPESSKWQSDANYPNGYEAFYIMKHELSQQAYMDFLNCLDLNQQKERAGAALPTGAVDTRFSSQDRCWLKLRIAGSTQPAMYGLMPEKSDGGITGSPYSWDDIERNGGNIAMSCLGWMDVAAYLCWAGLRPLSEMEYEKTCRGPELPNVNEYAWGMPVAVNTTNTPPIDYNFGEEKAVPSNANFIVQYAGTNFPLRVGCLTDEETTRADAGAAYYGALNMSDNVSEYYINVHTKQGLAFDGSHGIGSLDGMGRAIMPAWPSNTDGLGLIIRGIYNNDLTNAQVSNRNWKNIQQLTYGNSASTRFIGCRGGRTAPN